MLLAGRAVLGLAAFLIPLAFCRETMYIFQAKVLLLQYAGLSLLMIMAVHQLLGRRTPNLAGTWLLRFLWFFLFWEIFKSWDSVCPVISWREMTRIFWLPVIAVSVPYFVRTRAQLERLVSVAVVSALVANAYMWLIWNDRIAESFFNADQQSRPVFWGDFANFPVLGPLVKSVLYPPPFDSYTLPYVAGSTMSGEGFMTMGPHSLFAGKQDAGSFGNKNFLVTYLNMSSVLLIYRAITLTLLNKTRRWHHWAAAAVLVAVAAAALYHIGELRNRGAWLGLFFGAAAILAYSLWIAWATWKVSGRLILTIAGAGAGCVLVIVAGLFIMDTERFLSIFTVYSSSNELRIHTWNSYLRAWLEDRELWPSGSAWIVNDLWRWITGMGSYTFRAVYPKYRSPRIFQIEFNAHNTETSHAHNEYLQILGELGILGSMLYALFFGFLFYRLLKAAGRDDLRMNLLRGAVLFGLVSQMVTQFVCVGVRYTCIGFPFWFTVGLALLLCRPFEGMAGTAGPLRARATGILAIASALFVMPDAAIPLRSLQSEHFYEMGQLYYTRVRNAADAVERQDGLILKTREDLARKDSAELRDYLERSQKNLARIRNEFDRLYRIADEYFEAGISYDPANFESIYIGGNMNVQFARTALVSGNEPWSRHYYEQAANRYARVGEHSPYFVQVRYWQAMCYSGLGSIYHRRLGKGDLSVGGAMEENFRKALECFDLYQRQDLVMMEPYLEKFRIRLALENYYQTAGKAEQAGENTRFALRELVAALRNFERGGYQLFSSDRRMDTVTLVMEYMRLQKDRELSRRALAVLGQLAEQRGCSGLLPFVPKTERHIQSVFEFMEAEK